MAVLRDYIKIKHGFAFKGDHISNIDNGTVLVTPGNFAIGGGFKENKCKFFDGKYQTEYVLKPDDLIITMTDLSKTVDTLGYSALVPKSDRIYLHNQRIGLVTVEKKEELDKHYLYWFMRTPYYQKTVVATSSGSTVHHTSPDRIMDIEIKLPDLKTQRAIAMFMDNVEKKIHINEQINENLEQQAQAIFDDMFPNIFSLNTDATLQDLIIFANGKKRPKTIGNIPVYGGNGVLAYTDKSNADNCVIIGRVGAYCGNTFLCLNKCWTSDNAIQAKSRTSSSPLFIYYLLKNASLSSRHIGTGQPLMTQGILNSIHIKRPAEEKISAFIEICTPMHQMISTNKQQHESLALIRDTLLPKLMSGEIDISDIDI